MNIYNRIKKQKTKMKILRMFRIIDGIDYYIFLEILDYILKEDELMKYNPKDIKGIKISYAKDAPYDR